MRLQPKSVLHRLVAVLTVVALVLTTAPSVALFAQDAPPVLILPIDRATFLPGALFDVRVEVHAEAMPEDFAVTINGVDASEVTGVEPTEESWTFGDEAAPTTSNSML
jgi:hypothetical protein